MKIIQLLRILMLLFIVLLFSSCASIGTKSWGMSGSADGFDVQTTIDPKSGTASPKLSAGGGAYAMLFALARKTDEIYPTMIAYAKRMSMWDWIAGTTAGNVSFVYISGSAEKPEDTIKIINALGNALNEKKKPKIIKPKPPKKKVIPDKKTIDKVKNIT